MATLGQTYSITEVGSPSWIYSEAHGLNGSGEVVGEYEPLNLFNVLAFLFSSGTATNLGNLNGSPYAVAYAINDSGQIVGESNARFDTHAFLYESGKMVDLGTLTGIGVGGYSSAHGINHSGQVAGETSLALASTIHAALFEGGAIKDLGALGGDYSAAYGINNSGVIVGESDVVVAPGLTNVHAFVYTNGSSASMVDIGTLGGGYSSAHGVNESATVVGEAETVIDGVTALRAFVYRNGLMSDLGTLGGNTSSASAINSAGLIVGYATDSNEVANAFLYDGSKMINLMDLLPPNSGWTNLASADGINDAGQIIGSGYLADGEFQAYLLTPNSLLNVVITNPAANATFQAPATVSIDASVVSSSGTITNVAFRLNGGLVGNVIAAPYTMTVSNLIAGSYTLTAVAADNTGLSATNSIGIAVTNGTIAPIVISNPGFLGNNFSFSFGTQSGHTYSGQFATPLSETNNWLTFTNVIGNGTEVRVTDSLPTNAQRFYRVIAQ